MPDSTSQDSAAAQFLIELLTKQLPLVRAVLVATELNIADYLGMGERSVEELAQVAGVSEDNLYRLLRVLSSFGIFREVENRRFVNTNISDMLRSGASGSLRELVLWDAGPLTWKSLEGLGDCVRSGETSFEKTFGMPFFDYLEHNPVHKKTLYNALKSFSQMTIPAIMKGYDFSRCKRIVDVGGGEGDLISAIHEDNPDIECILFDRTEIVSQLNKTNTKNIEVVGGDFFSEAPPSADCYILKMILHDWNDGQSIRILKNCRESLEQGGRLLVIEPALIKGSPHELFSTMLDLDMMILTGGKERTPDEFRTLFNAAGLEFSRVISTESPLYIVEATRA